MTESPGSLRRPWGIIRAVATSPFTLWTMFVLAHLWLGLLNLYAPGQPLGDVTLVYKFWTDQAIQAHYWVGIDGAWVYPIVALVPMLIAAAFGPTLYASTWLSLVMIVNAAAFAVLTRWGRSRENNAAAWWWVAFLFLLGPIALGRIDSITAPLAIIGVLMLASRPRAAAAVLSIATWIKVWPAALIVAAVIAMRSRRIIVFVTAVTSVSIVLIALAFGSGLNVFSFITQQTARGLQIEAPISTIWLWRAAAGLGRTFVYYDRAILTYQVTGDGTQVASAITTPLLGLAFLGVCALGILATRRGAAVGQLLPSLALALVSGLMVFNKVGSPQFATWLAVPIILGLVTAANADGRSFRAPAIMVLVIAGMTQLIYPYLYVYLFTLNAVMLILITARNLLVIALFAWAVVSLWQVSRVGTFVEASADYESTSAPWPWETPTARAEDPTR
jgi:Glycosyltransferase family 87